MKDEKGYIKIENIEFVESFAIVGFRLFYGQGSSVELKWQIDYSGGPPTPQEIFETALADLRNQCNHWAEFLSQTPESIFKITTMEQYEIDDQQNSKEN